MLQKIREHSGSLVVKIILSVIGASFIVFGITDVVRILTATPPVAKVGSMKIHFQDFYTIYQRYVSSLRRSNEKLSSEVLQTAQKEVLDHLINELILEYEPDKLGVVVPQSVVTRYITNIPVFLKNGVFDAEVFKTTLQRVGMNPKSFASDISKQLKHQQFLTPMTSGIILNNRYIDFLMDVIFRKRRFEVVIVPERANKKSEPTQKNLEIWLMEHPEKYQIPEQRDIKIVTLEHSVVQDKISVSKENIAEEIVSNQGGVIEHKEVRALSFDSESLGHEAKFVVTKERDADKIKAAFPETDFNVIDSSLLPKDVAECINGLAKWESYGPILVKGKWVVYVVTNIQMETVPALSSEESTLRIKKRNLPFAVEGIKDQIDDAIAAGQSFDEMSGNFPIKIADIKGVTRKNIEEKLSSFDSNVRKVIVDQTFALPKNGESSFIDVNDVSVMVVVTDVTEAHAPKLGEVQYDVTADWLASEKHKNAYEWAYNAFGRAQDDPTLWPILVTKHGIKTQNFEVSRFDAQSEQSGISTLFNQKTIDRIFLIKTHSVDYVETKDGNIAVVFVCTLNAGQQNALDTGIIEKRNSVRESLTRGVQSDATNLVLHGIKSTKKVKIAQKSIDRLNRIVDES
ncbi:MAG: SurA N-terminal domain-containing protein [Holosporales bacterium]|jgi:peptidyl-prolyl cis-trans isomerase D|nr:SurA N-terminal domain-containing protein [Holosporales bacterium]